MKPTVEYKKQLALSLNCNENNITLQLKGRVGLYGILKSLGITQDDEVIIPAFTCVVVPNAIKYLGAKPIYIDIDSKTFNIKCKKVENAITNKTKIIVAQNTFGLSCNVEKLLKIANKFNLILIEDCTHGFGGCSFGKPNGKLSLASFYSSQWNKTFSTGLGGMVYTSDEILAKKLRQFEETLKLPSFKTVTLLKLQYFIRKYILTANLYWSAIKLFRWLSKYNLVKGSSSGEELTGTIKPADYLTGMSEWQAIKGIESLKYLTKNLHHRQLLAFIYNKKLEQLGINPILGTKYASHTYIQFPLLVKNRNHFQKIAEKEKIQLGDWFLSPIHPILNNFNLWDYEYGNFPIAEFISSHIVNLKTDLTISKKEAIKTTIFLEKYKEQLLYPNEMKFYSFSKTVNV